MFFAAALAVATLWLPPLTPQADANPLAGLDARPVNASCLAGDTPAAAPIYVNVFTQIASFKPFDLRQSPGDPNRWYFISRDGRVYTFLAPNGQPQLVLDIRDRIGVLNSSNAYSPGGSEHWGLVSFALDPDFATNGRIFVLYNGRQANETAATSYVARYTSNGDGTPFDRQTEKAVISRQQPNGVTHHFGHLAFGPDGYLYIGAGDGFAPASAQNCNDLRGKILRIDINTTAAYSIPADNPFVGSSTCRREVYALGVRNPWRFSFDKETGRLWVGDVGGTLAEEVNIVENGGNYGWPITEGFGCRNIGDVRCGDPALRPPVYAFPHGEESVAVIGGLVYRGSALPSLVGSYVFSIYGLPNLLALGQHPTTGVWTGDELATGNSSFSSHFVDRAGELYSLNGHVSNPIVRKLVPDPNASTDFGIPDVLSATGCVNPAQPRQVVSGAIPYSLISPLWSDGAEKRRWAALPTGAKVTITSDGDFMFPVNSVLIKEFSLAGKPVETRLFKRHTNGTWAGYTYAWRDDLSDADLVPAAGMPGPTIPGTNVTWSYPSRSQCLVCHTEAARFVLGPEIQQLNRISPTPYPQSGRTGNELATWAEIGLFNGPLPAPIGLLPAIADPSNFRAAPALRARSYLHMNCAGCHRPNGPTRVALDLRYTTLPSAMNACGVPPVVSDLGVAGAQPIVAGRHDLSLVHLRMTRRDVDQMPQIGTARVDTAGAAVVQTWININGQNAGVSWNACTDVVDSDADGIPDNSDNCITRFNPNQIDSNNNRIGDRCDGDFDSNLVVNATDRQKLVNHLGARFGDPQVGGGWGPKYDLDGDGYINQSDLDIFDAELLGNPRGPSALRK